jgi:2-polyprenyl-3-methyl-5-hydroxy-6-metoxy-1,4-benzoquinol methylase
VNDRFDFHEDARADLAAFRRRLEKYDPAEPADRAAVETSGRRGRKSLWRKAKFYLSALIHLSRSRRRIDALEDATAALRRTADGHISSDVTSAWESQCAALEHRIDEIQHRFDELGRAHARERDALQKQIDEFGRLIRVERMTRQKAFSQFDRRLGVATSGNALEACASSHPEAKARETSLQALLETFYFLLEERYRGPREEIKQRLLIYGNDFRAARGRTGISGPIIDIGCGRGELLEMLHENGFQAIGVDWNDTQLEAARRHGAAVVHSDALAFLRTLDSESVLAVAGIHVVEHIPFPDLVLLVQEVARVLKKGGIVVFETPNPRNLIVGATTFHLDPTHIRPLPAEVLQILLETVGFDAIEQRPLHPSDTLEYMVSQHNLDRHVATLLFGPQDYAVIGLMS